MWFGDEEEVARLEEAGHGALEAGDVDAALTAAEALLELGWSGGFALEALAHARAGRLDVAAARLEAGVARAPDAWPLWQLLGNLRSDLGRLDDAAQAYDRALAIEGSAQASIRFNRAVAYRRAGRPGDALADLDPILGLANPPPEIASGALSLTLECLAAIGRAAEAEELIEGVLATCAPDDPRRPRLEAEHALALDRAGADRERVVAAFTRATDGGEATPGLLALGRALYPTEAAEPVRFHLVVQGPPPTDTEAAGFLRVFDVVAAGPEQALELARRFVPVFAREALQIERVDVREAQSALAAGVYAASELMLFA